MAGDPSEVTIHYLRPPDRLQLFHQWLIHEDAEVKVTFARDLQLDRPLRIANRIALERGSDAVWFTFPEAWHDIGRFHRADGTLTGIYANVIVPCLFEPEGVWRTTDLFLDLWIPAEEGRWERGPSPAATVLDREELDQAEAQGWVDSPTAERARAEAARLLRAARTGDWPPPVVAAWPRDRALNRLSRAS